MKAQIFKAKDLLKHNKVIKISDKIFDVGDYIVSVQKKPGRNILTCSCWQGTNFCNEGICSHKISVLLYLANNNFYDKVDKLLNDYKKINKLKMKIDTDIVISDLESLKFTK